MVRAWQVEPLQREANLQKELGQPQMVYKTLNAIGTTFHRGLPDDLKPLARRHALELRHTRFNSDADAIMRALEKMVPPGHLPWRYIGSGPALVLIIVLGVLWPIFNAKLHPPAPVAVNWMRNSLQKSTIGPTQVVCSMHP